RSRRDFGGIEVGLTNLDKVLFPVTGTTKGEVIDYFTAIAPALLPHIAQRAVTRKRWPNGVEESSFFEKNLPTHAPKWLQRRGRVRGWCSAPRSRSFCGRWWARSDWRRTR